MRDRPLKLYRIALDLFVTLRLHTVCSDLYPFIYLLRHDHHGGCPQGHGGSFRFRTQA